MHDKITASEYYELTGSEVQSSRALQVQKLRALTDSNFRAIEARPITDSGKKIHGIADGKDTSRYQDPKKMTLKIKASGAI